MTTYTYFTADLITGKVMANLPLREVSIDEPALNEPSTLSASLDLIGLGLPIDDIKVATATARTALYVDVDGQLLWGGLIWKRRLSGHVLELSASDFLSYYARRRITVSRLFTEGLDDQFEIVRTLLRDAAVAAGGDIGVNLGTGASGRTRGAQYLASDNIPVLQAVQELAAGLDGFDFAITVAYDNNGLATKNLQLGYPQLGRPKETTELLIEYPGSVSQWQWPEEGDRMITTAFVRGEASGDVVPIAERTDTGLLALGYPRLEEEFPPPTNAILIQALEAEAVVKLAAFRNPVVLPTFTIPVGIDDPHPGTYRVGDQFRVRISDPQWMPAYPDGRAGFDDYMRLVGRSIQVAPGGGQSVALTMSTLSGILSGGLPVPGTGVPPDVPPVIPPGPAIFARPTITLSKLLPTGAPLVGDDVTVLLTPTVDPALTITRLTLTMDGVPVTVLPAPPAGGPYTFTYHDGAPTGVPPTVTVTRVGGDVATVPTLFTEGFETGPTGATLIGATTFTSWSPATGTATFAAGTGGGGTTTLFTEDFAGGSNGATMTPANTIFNGNSSETGTAVFTNTAPYSGGLAGRYISSGASGATGTATFTEDFEAGTDTVSITTGNSFFNGFGSTTGTVKFSNVGGAAVGSMFARFSNPGGNDAISMYKTLGSVKTTQAVSFYFRFATLPTDDINICTARTGGTPPGTAGTTVAASLRLQPTGKLILRNGASNNGAASGTTLAINTWYRVEWKLVAGASQELKIFSPASATVATETMTGRAFTAANVDNFVFGLTQTPAVPSVWHLDIDGVQIGDNYPGPWPGGGAAEQAISTYKTLTSDLSTAAVGTFVRIPAFPPATTAVITARGPADALRGSLRINTAGKLEVRNGVTTVATSTATLPLNAWFRIDWRVDALTSTQEARLFLGANSNGSTPDEVLTGAYPTTTAGTVNNFAVGIINSLAAWYFDIDFFRIAATYPGPVTSVASSAYAGALYGRYAVAGGAGGTDTALFTESFEGGTNDAAVSTSNTFFNGYDSTAGIATITNTSPYSGALHARYISTGTGGGGSPTSLYFEDFEGATAGTAISTGNTFIGGFGSAAGTAVFNATAPLMIGTKFARLSSTGSQAISFYKTFASTATTQAVGFYLRFGALPPAGTNVNICNARSGGTPPGTAGTTVAASLRLQDDGKLILRNGASNNGAASTTTLAVDTWYRVEWKLIGGTSQELKIFTTPTSSTAAETMSGRALTAANFDNFLFGLTAAVTDWRVDIDGIQIHSDYPGPWPAAGTPDQAVATYKTLTSTLNTAAIGMFMKIPVAPPQVTAVASARGPADALRGSLRINTAGKLEVRNGATLVDTSVATLPTGAWFRVDWRVDATTGTQEARLFATDPGGVSADEVLTGAYPSGAAGTVSNFAVGIINSLSAWWLDLDMIRIAATFPGPPVGTTNQAIASTKALGATMTTVATSFFGRFAAAPPSASAPCLAKLGAATSGLIRINTDRSVNILNGASTVVGSTSAAGLLPVDSWWRMDWKVSSATATQELRIFVGANRNGSTADATLTGAFTTGAVDAFTYGIPVEINPWALDIDGLRIAADFPGPYNPTPNPTPFVGDLVTVKVATTIDTGLSLSSLILTRDGAPVSLTADGTYTYTA